MKKADRAYAIDTNADDPNQAFKGQWPSAFLWLACVRLAARISPGVAEQTASLVTDQEIAASVRVEYANSLLGGPAGPSEVEERHKNGQSMYSFSEP
jgi:hypothetical protein